MSLQELQSSFSMANCAVFAGKAPSTLPALIRGALSLQLRCCMRAAAAADSSDTHAGHKGSSVKKDPFGKVLCNQTLFAMHREGHMFSSCRVQERTRFGQATIQKPVSVS